MPNPITIFDRRLLRKRRDHVAGNFQDYDFIKREAAIRLADRLPDIAREFPLALDLGCHTGQLHNTLQAEHKVGRLIQADLSAAMAIHAQGDRVVCDEEWLPFAEDRFDLVMSVMSLHWVNDLPGSLVQIRRILKPDGLFLAVIPGANTLRELRESFTRSESDVSGGVLPHISPFVEVRDAGNLLQRAGFALPVVDCETIDVSYSDPLQLMLDLRGMGETNLLHERAKHMANSRSFRKAIEHYQTHYGSSDGMHIPATVELVMMTAWKPHPSQQQPAERGSGQVNLNQLFD